MSADGGDAPAPGHAKVTGGVQSKMAPLILVADDDPDIRRVLRGLLEPFAEIVEAADGAQALERLRSVKPRLLLLDVVMPELSGIAVLQAARELIPSLPVLMLTGESDLAMAQLALESGALAYITKPFEPERLLDEVRRLLDPSAPPSSRPWRVRL
ncbi:MAG: response regulator [Elusimicrobia bacterium]|nr:response regulator [Elusimicrobiota bacterium]